ncbi:MAG: virS 15 [Myxococcaceae bacterium]|nr:virS 15 [Myxococcaceae bacterium]
MVESDPLDNLDESPCAVTMVPTAKLMFVSVIIVRGIVAELKVHGIEPAQALELFGLKPDALSDIRARISFTELDHIIRKAMELSADAGLGLSMGVNAPESMLQVLGHLVVSCRTLREAFALFQRYSPLIVDGVSYRLSEGDDRGRFDYHCPVPMGATSRFAAEYVLVMVQRIAAHFVPEAEATPELVHFEHEQPDYHARYGRVFGCPIVFGQEANSIVFPRRVLDVPQLHADPTMHSALREMAERLLTEMHNPVATSERVRGLLRYESELSVVDVVKLARGLGLTPRSLRRRLAAEGLSLTALLDEARCRMACEELRREGSIKEIAERVGFSEPSAFHRAFKRWTGLTPLAYARGA